MSFKTGGYKTKYISECGYFHEEFIIYCAVESVSDTCVYKMFNENGEEVDISISAEDDTEGVGNHSLIDCLFYLKHWCHIDKGNFYTIRNKDFFIEVEEMTQEEMKKIFGR